MLSASPMTKGERQRLIAHLEMTGQWLADEVKGLTPAQLKWRKDGQTWSVADVVEHLAVAEPQYWASFKEGMAAPATDQPAKSTEAAMLWYGIDRTNRNKTGEAREPKGQFGGDFQKSFDSFKKLRSEMLNYVRTTEDALHAHRYPKSETDLYHWLVMISSHSQRHILQVREIKAMPGFPKK